MALAALQPSGLRREAWPAGGQPAQALCSKGGRRGSRAPCPLPERRPSEPAASPHAGPQATRVEVAGV